MTTLTPLQTLAEDGRSSGPALSTYSAIVKERAGLWILIDGPYERALRAQSCLIEPEPGDLVMVCAPLPASNGTPDASTLTTASFVLAVLTRPQPEAGAVLTLPGGATLGASDGGLEIRAQNLALNADAMLSINSQTLHLDNTATHIATRNMTARMQSVDAAAGQLKWLAQTVASTVGRVVQRAKQSIRWVDETDELRAGQVQWNVKDEVQVQSGQTTLLSEHVTRIDGERIELG
jgi:hypothetical protein